MVVLNTNDNPDSEPRTEKKSLCEVQMDRFGWMLSFECIYLLLHSYSLFTQQ